MDLLSGGLSVQDLAPAGAHAEATFLDRPLTMKQAIALHESAHAVVAIALGLPLMSVEISAEGGGHCELGGSKDVDGAWFHALVTAAGSAFFAHFGLELPAGLSGQSDWLKIQARDDLPHIRQELGILFARLEVRRAICVLAGELQHRRRIPGQDALRLAFAFGVEPIDLRAQARRALAEGRLKVAVAEPEIGRVVATFRTAEGRTLRLGKAARAGWWCDCAPGPDRGLCVHLLALREVMGGPLGVE